METNLIQQKSNSYINEAKGIIIVNSISYDMACEFLKSVKGLQKEIEDTFDPIVKKAHEAHKEATTQRKKFLDPLQKAESEIKDKMARYFLEQEKIKKLEEIRIQKEIEDKKLVEAELLQAEGKTESAEIVLNSETPKIFVETIEKKYGIQYRENWTFEIMDFKNLPDEYKMPDLKKIGAIVKAMKSQTSIVGVRAFPEKSVYAKI